MPSEMTCTKLQRITFGKQSNLEVLDDGRKTNGPRRHATRYSGRTTPARRDFPGIDTVQPQELHEQRSDHAQAVDERDLAPIADSREQWAMHPDDYDLPGVDTPADYEGDDGGGLFF